MAAVAAFGGVPRSGDTFIETFHSDVRVAPEGIRADGLNMVVRSVGSLTGEEDFTP